MTTGVEADAWAEVRRLEDERREREMIGLRDLEQFAAAAAPGERPSVGWFRAHPEAAELGPAHPPPQARTGTTDRRWPVMDSPAFYGLAGQAVELLDPYTEADRTAVLLSLLAGAGSALGPAPAVMADGAAHPGRLFVCIVGETSKARKGTATRRARQVLTLADPTWERKRIMSGLSSGEGLIAQVSDPPDEDPGERPAPADKRLLVVEEEFARVLAVARREASTLSAILRQAWDSGDLAVLTKTKQAASGAHVSIVGHITVEELKARLTETDMANGMANRILFALVRRSKLLAESADVPADELQRLGSRMRAALSESRRRPRLGRTDAFRGRWEALYAEMAEDDPGGLLGAIVARPESQTLRLALIYAALDAAPAVDLGHLEAAWAVWRYCRASAEFIFGDALGDEDADKLLAEVRRSGAGGLDGAAQSAVFGRHRTAKQLSALRDRLEAKGLVVTVSEGTGGRPRIITYDIRHAPEVEA